MSNKVSIESRAEQLTALLAANRYRAKQSFDASSINNAVNHVRQAFGTVSDENKTLLRNAAIGAGLGAGAGYMASADDENRTLGALRGAATGGAIGAGGTAWARFLKNRGLRPPTDAAVAQAVPAAADGDSSIMNAVRAIVSRPITIATGAATAGRALYDQYEDRFLNRSYADRRFSSPFNTLGKPHDPHTTTPATGLKGLLGDNDFHTEQIGKRIQNNLEAWRQHYAQVEPRDFADVRSNIAELSRQSPEYLASIARIAGDHHKAPRMDPQVLTDIVRGIPEGRARDFNNVFRDFRPGELDRLMNSAPPMSGKMRAANLGGLAAMGLAEPYLWSGLGSALGLGNSPRLTSDQIAALNSKYFGN